MPITYVLVYSKNQMNGSVISQLDEIKEIKEVSKVDGPFDFIVKMESKEKLSKNTLTDKIAKIPEIKNLLTLSVAVR